MKDESTLDAAGPLTIIGLVTVVLAIATWIMLDAQGSWGSASVAAPPAAETTAAPH
jgi:hypothetical protein